MHRILRGKEKKSEEEPPYPDESSIVKDMAKRATVIRFDLSDDKWLKDPDAFWREFKHTGEILIPEDFEKWLIGQERLKEELYLQLEEWVRKRKKIEELRRTGKGDDKSEMKKFLKEWPGPYLLIMGEPGTGKSLLIKIAKSILKKVYAREGIPMPHDVLLIADSHNKQKVIAKYVPAGRGKAIKDFIIAGGDKDLKQIVIRSFFGFVMLIGALLILTAMLIMVYFGLTLDPSVAWFKGSGVWLQWLFYGMMLMVFPLFILMFTGGGFGIMRGRKGEGKNQPSLAVDNSGDPDLALDVTSTNAADLFGSVQHDPWQSGGLGTSLQHRMQAGLIHRADGMILFFDEFQNFLQNDALVTEILTPLEDGMYPIRARSWAGAEGNASLAGQSDPVDCSFFLIAAANYNSLPLLNKYSMLRSRFYYGNIIPSDDEIDASPQNEVKIAQFVADEAYRFHTPPICREAVKVIISHARRKGSSSTKMRLQMRPYIQDIKKAAQLVWRDRGRDWSPCACGQNAVNMVHRADMVAAIETYAKPIEQAMLDQAIQKHEPYKILQTTGTAVGKVNGLVVIGDSAEGRSGDVVTVSAWLRKIGEAERKSRPPEGYFTVTGAPVSDKDTWMQNSIRTVRTTIYRLYGVDLYRDYYVHVSFLQSDAKAIDGPSAGITMTLAVMSCLGDPRVAEGKRKPVPIRQDTAITGTVENLGEDGDVQVGPIGGVFEKIYGAAKWKMKRVIVPNMNYDHTYFERFDSTMSVIVKGAGTVLRYFDLMRADIPRLGLRKRPGETNGYEVEK